MDQTIRQRVSNAAALDEPNYPENQWWVAATSLELGREPIQRWLLGLPVLLYRGADGRAVALDDRCPHRWAPLSSGHVDGNEIVCGYHGFRFGPDGNCTGIPTQEKVPSGCRIRSYPVLERTPFVWVWTGDRDLADAGESLPDLAWTTDPSRVTASGAMEVACNYMAIKENVLDLSHFAYVHAATLAVKDWTAPPKTEKTGDTVSYRQIFTDLPLPAHYGVPTGIGCDRPVLRDSWGTYVSPALVTAGVDITDPEPLPGRRPEFALRLVHATTPVDEGKCYYWWYFSQDYGHGDGAAQRLTERITSAFVEDKAILEATELLVRRDRRGRDYPEISVACDHVGIESRRRLQQSLVQDRDRGRGSQAQSPNPPEMARTSLVISGAAAGASA